jgi:hypothetical protein
LYGGTDDDILERGHGSDYIDRGQGIDIIMDFNWEQGDNSVGNCEKAQISNPDVVIQSAYTSLIFVIKAVLIA